MKAKYLPANAHLNLTYKNPRLPSLYLLLKIHKPGNPGRPIISACGGPTEKISAFVNSILKPFVYALPSHVKDTTHFLILIQDLRIPTNHTLMAIDVSSLYTNIPHKEGLAACRKLLGHSLEMSSTPKTPKISIRTHFFAINLHQIVQYVVCACSSYLAFSEYVTYITGLP